ncbi:MAG: D-aminoacyl-tRNA deacylase [Paenibacillaceae bacterium]
MRIVVQRSKEAQVSVDGVVIGQISRGLVLLVGITHEDTEKDVRYLVEKIINLRIFEDDNHKMNISLKDMGGSVLSISQFTLYGDCNNGRRPSFTLAAKPDQAEPLYEKFNELIREQGIVVQTGKFGATMDVSLVNSGPVTLIVDSPAHS